MWKKVVFIILLVLLFGIGECYAFWVWTPQSGKWTNPKYAVKDTPQDQFEWAMDFFNNKDYKRARKEFENLVKHFPRAKEAADAQFFVGECYDKMGYYYHAFKAYQQVIDEFPYSKKIDGILLKQYEIGHKYLSGERYKSLGLALLPAYMKAGDIFTQVHDNAPHGPYADKSLYYAGQAYIKAGMYDDALGSFSKLIKDYSDSQYVEKTQLAIADLNIQQNEKPYYDQKALDQAINDFEKYLEDNPDAEFNEEAMEALELLQTRKALHYFDIAQFYERTGNLKAAQLSYEKIVRDYDKSEYVDIARERLQEIDQIMYGDYIEIVQIPANKSTPLAQDTKNQEQNKQIPVEKQAQLDKQEVVKEEVPAAEQQEPAPAQTEISTDKAKQMDQTYQQLQKTEEKPIVVSTLDNIQCTNYENIAKISIATDNKFKYAHFTMDNPYRLIIDPVTRVQTSMAKKYTYQKGIISSIEIFQDTILDSDLPADAASDKYHVDYIVVEFNKEIPCEVIMEDKELIVKAGDYLEDFVKAKQDQKA